MSNEPTTILQLNEFLPYQFNILSKKISQALSAIYTTEFGITVPEFRTLVWLHSNPNIYAKDLCALTMMDKTQVSRVIHALEKRDLLRRQADRNDQRSYQLSLTESGTTLIAQIIPKAIAWEQRLLEALTPQQYKQLQVIVEKLETQVTELAGKP